MKKHLFLLLFLATLTLQAQIKIGDNIEEVSPYGLLELESQEKGLILPRMNTAQRDAAFDQSAPEGLMIFNTDLNKAQVFRLQLDASSRRMSKVWENAQAGISLVNAGELPPANPSSGQLYFDAQLQHLFVWNGNAWVDTTAAQNNPQTPSASPQSLTLSQTILSISEGNSVDLAALVTTGPAGPQGEVGPQGKAGPAGATGPQGPAGTAGSGTDSQTLTASALSANSTLTLAISDGNTVTLDLSSLDNSGTHSQTLAYGSSATSTATTLEITDGNSLTLQASGSLSFTQTGTNTLELAVTQTDAIKIIDTDGDTQVQVEEGADDDTIRFDTAGIEIASFTSTQTNFNTAITASSTLAVSGNTTLTSDVVVVGTTTLATTTLGATLQDVDGDAGTAGQVLSSTGTSTNWIDMDAVASGTQTGTTLYWDGSEWVETTALRHGIVESHTPFPSSTPFTAYSLRRVITSYSGSAIRVRRSSDNVEQDIGFTSAGELATSTLLSFVGAGNDGFVTRWYDQGAGGNDVSQATSSDQPRIVIAGVLETMDNGKPAVDFAAGNYLFASPTNAFSSSAALTSLGIAEYNTGDAWQVPHRHWQAGAQRIHLSFKNNTTNGVTLFANGANRGTTAVVPQGQTAAIGYVIGASGSFISIDGTQTSITDTALPSVSGNDFELGYRSSNYFIGKQSELLFYTEVLSSSDYTAIEDNQEAYWIAGTTPAEVTTSEARIIVENVLELDNSLMDADGDSGTAGQVLTSTGTSTNWIDSSPLAVGTQQGNTLYWDGSEWVETTALQNIISSHTPVPSNTPFTAYSLRRVITSYSGSAIRVRRSSDNVEQDIGFTSSGELAVSTLLSFVGAGNDGFVTRWYDQGAGGNDISQATPSDQPRIVIAGVLETMDNGKPAVDFAASDHLFASPTNAFSTSASLTSLGIAEYNTGDAWQVPHRHWQAGAQRIHLSFKNNTTNGVTLFDSGTLAGTGGTVPQGQTAAIGYVIGTSGSFVSVDGTKTAITNLTASLPSASGNAFELGYRSSNYFIGKQSELLFYTNVLSSSDYKAIEDNQEAYWIAGTTPTEVITEAKVIVENALTVSSTALITGAVQLSNYGAGAVQSDANGNLSVSSDERLKTMVGSFERGLEEILQLKPINYRWNAQSGLDQKGMYSGFSAQNVQSVIPEAVGQDQKGYLTLSDRPIIGALVNAIKELNTKNQALAKENKSLKDALEALVKRVEQLEEE